MAGLYGDRKSRALQAGSRALHPEQQVQAGSPPEQQAGSPRRVAGLHSQNAEQAESQAAGRLQAASLPPPPEVQGPSGGRICCPAGKNLQNGNLPSQAETAEGMARYITCYIYSVPAVPRQWPRII